MVLNIAKGKAAPKSAATKATSKSKSAKEIKTKGKPTNAPESYSEIRKMLDKPLSECKPLPIGRNGAKVAPRRFHLLADDVAKLQTEYKETKRIPNPHNRGAYFYFVGALITLGKDKAHSFRTVKDQMRLAMSASDTKDENGKSDWQRFVGKEAHTDDAESALDVDGRLKQNAYVLQRLGGLTPYGLKLLQVGQQVLKTKGLVIDILKDKDGSQGEKSPKGSKGIAYRLNTNSATPINETIRQRKAN